MKLLIERARNVVDYNNVADFPQTQQRERQARRALRRNKERRELLLTRRSR
jgi:hypothetical protein